MPRTVVITGASSGIGRALLEACAAADDEVFACARRADALDVATRANTIARGRVCDVADESRVKDFLGWVESYTPRIDALVNCAGGFGAIGPVETSDSSEWWDTLRVNLFGTYVTIKQALKLLERSPDPRIINFSGGGAFSSFPNYSAYACSKAGVVRLTECLADELAPKGIAVNAVAPGFVATEIHLATLAAGPDRAGAEHYKQTTAVLDGAGAQMANVVDCIRHLLSPQTKGLTGKTISANFDPWRTAAFRESIPAIVGSDLWTMRRVNLVNLPDGGLRADLSEAST